MTSKFDRTETVTITLNGVEQQAEVIVRSDYTRKAYYGRYGSKPRVFVDVADESILENLENRRNRPTKVYREVVKQALAQAGIGIESLLWSQHAGCTCACSPGFILKTNGGTHTGKDEYTMCWIWVKIKKQAGVQNDGYITPLENYGFGEFGRSVTAEEVVADDTAVMC